ncbi:unnamed protein product [Rhizopus stolonifer]
MSTFTKDFPLELFDKICHYLTNKQKVTCQTVCQSWRNAFAASQYSNVQIHGRKQLQLFFLSLLTNGRYIKALTIQVIYLASEEVLNLPKLCPNIVKLKLNTVELAGTINNPLFSEWEHLKRLDQNLTQHHSLSNLYHLSIYLHIQSLDSIIPLLSASNCLKVLSIHSGNLSLDELEIIHTICPKLQELYLINIKMDHRFAGTLSPPALHMQTLEAKDVQGLDQWLLYFASKYPNLKHISLWHKHSVYHPISSLPLEALEIQWRDLAQIGYSCRALESVSFLNISVNPWFFEALDRSETSLVHSDQQPTHLTLWGWSSLCIPEMMEETMTLVNQCSSRLKSFEFSMEFSGILYAPLSLDILFATFGQLSQLSLGYVQLISTPIHKIILKRLLLKESAFFNHLFDHLSSLCPRLTDIKLESCSLIDGTQGDVRIHMPHHKLQSLDISRTRPFSTRFHRSLMKEIKFFQVLTKRRRHFYELIDYEGHRPAGYTLSTEQSPYVSICCESIDELRIAGFLIN